MFYFVTGKTGCGKSAFIYEKLLLLSEQKNVYFLVPEQFEFETERKLLLDFGTDKSRQIKVTTFTKIADEIHAEFDKEKQAASDVVKEIILYQTLKEAAPQLSYYKESALKPSFSTLVLKTIAQLKAGGMDAIALDKKIAELPEFKGALSAKINDMLLIFHLYHANLEAQYSDKMDSLSKATLLAQAHSFFKDKVLFVDGFDVFSGNQKAFLCAAAADCEDYYQAFTLDINAPDNNLYHQIERSFYSFKSFADMNNLPYEIINFNDIVRYKGDVLTLAEHLFHEDDFVYNEEIKDVRVIRCDDYYAEATFVAAEIKRLIIRENYAYRDIAILARNPESYISAFESTFEKYEIPVFFDVPKSIVSHPMIKQVITLLDVLESFTTENILRYLKAGFVRIPDDKVEQGKLVWKKLSLSEINDLESFAYVWDIKGKDWQAPFPEAYPILEKLRAKIITPILQLKEKLHKANGSEKIKLLATFLIEDISMTGAIYSACSTGEEEQPLDPVLVAEYQQLWEVFLGILEGFHKALGEWDIAFTELSALLKSVFSKTNAAKPPQFIDTVLFGGVERTKLSATKAVFVIGMNDGVFPQPSQQSGIFNENELEKLLQYGIEIGVNRAERYSGEVFLVYRALTSASEKLYMTYPLLDFGSSALTASPVFDDVYKLFPNLKVESALRFGEDFYCTNLQVTRQRLARVYRNAASKERMEILQALAEIEENEAFLNKLNDVLSTQGENSHLHPVPQKYMERLFKAKRISATRFEQLSQCSFRYFCKYGVRADQVAKKGINSLETGNIVHYVLHHILQSYQADYRLFEAESLDNLKSQCQLHLAEYKKEFLLGDFAKTRRFELLYQSLTEMILKLLESFQHEFKTSDFRPKYFELSIDANQTVSGINALPLKVKTKNAGNISLFGKLDRLDVLKQDDKTHIRVIDYKTGMKEFSLPVLYYGLDTQMLSYLFALWENNTDMSPAGVMYYPSGKEVYESGSRTSNKNDRLKRWLSQHRLSGLAVTSEAVVADIEKLRAMHKELTNSRASFLKVESLSEKQLTKLKKILKKKIAEKLDLLYSGELAACPTVNGEKSPCSYCEYATFCRKNKAKIAVKEDVLKTLLADEEEKHELD